MVADGIATIGMYQCIKVDVKTLWADVIAMGLTSLLVLWCYLEPNPIHVADGTCLCFCLGMDY